MSFIIAIQGKTKEDKVFRPSDWRQRLASGLAKFNNDQKLIYSNYVQPCECDTPDTHTKCLKVNTKLASENKPMYLFLIDFAKKNNLVIKEACDLYEDQ